MPSGADMKRTAGAADETIVLNGAGRAALQKGLEMASAAMEDLDPALMARGIEMIQEAIAGSSNGGQAESEVVRLRVGEFKDTDAFHRGSGQAAIYSGPGGSYLLRLENLDVTNGPALHVYLSLHADPESADDVKRPGYLDLGKQKGNRGNQNYPIPAGTDISTFNSVVIYCKPFAVVFSVASLGDAA